MNTFLPFSKPTIDEATIASVADTLRSGWITSGPKVAEFEKQLSDYFGGRIVRTFNSGTCTMEIALRIAGIGAGDEVITTPISWVATANVILEVGATPVFADIDPVTRNLDLDKVEAAITPRTKAIIPVYLAGRPLDMDRLYAIASKYKLRVIEDAAQAIGSTWQGKPIGSFGDFVSFSFQANKNITTSEGGCLVLNNAEEATLAEKYRLQGVSRSGWDGIDVDVLGGKYNMTDIAAAIGLGQFAQLDKITAQRRKLAQHYFKILGSDFEEKTGAQLPPEDFKNTNWHLFQIVLPDSITRPQFMERMKAFNIGVGFHYAPIHLFKLYRELGFKEGMYPIAEHVGKQIVSLPMYYAMTEADVERTCVAMREVLQG
ncbi:MAG: DegT/DnrJ/EryC1/StrS aminotransferase family protein [Gallionella sp.]|nr:DegT/DnrJ/EryC1/StrS aminotransferase family protein [Gallionella sp.]